MNDHRKLVEDCINKRADNHAKFLKMLDKTCEKIAKHEPKVWLTVEEACEILDYLSFLKWRHFNDEFLYGLADCNKRLNKRIEQAEKEKTE